MSERAGILLTTVPTHVRALVQQVRSLNVSGLPCRYLGCEDCSVKASGTLLPSLALLDQLQELHLDRNWFNGTLPPAFAFGFPALVKLRLDYNSLTVSVLHTLAPKTLACHRHMYTSSWLCQLC